MTFAGNENIIKYMRPVRLLIIEIFLSCSREEPRIVPADRYLASLRSADELGSFNRLSEDGRSILPMFAAGDSLIFFQRLLVADANDTTGRGLEEMVKPYGLKISDGELYTISGDYEYPFPRESQKEAPQRPGESLVLALESPDGNSVAYESMVGNSTESHTVYLLRGDSITQLTYGSRPGFIGCFSNTGKYLCLIYGRINASLLIYDMEADTGYRVEKDSASFDYLPAFSTDDRMMVFIRSRKEFSIGPNFFGDIWILKFGE